MKTTINSCFKTLLSLFSLVYSFSAFSQAPQKMSYQAVIRNSSNTLVANANVGMRISILQGSATGNASYVETHNPTTNSNGLVTIQIGNGTLVAGSFTAINWASGIYFIKTETDLANGTNYTIIATSQLLSVPYALSSGDNKWNAAGNDISNKNTGNVGIGNNNPSYILDLSKRMRLRSESAQLGAGIWFNNNSNSALNTFLGNDTNNNLQVYSQTDTRSIAHFNPATGGFRVEGPAISTPAATTVSIGAAGKVEIDKAGLSGGRFTILENGNVGIGTNAPTTKLEVNGFSKLGTDAPCIKMKKIMWTTASTQGGTTSFNHGLDPSKIISVSILVESALNFFTPNSYDYFNGFWFSFEIFETSIVIRNGSAGIGLPGSASILSKPVKILITYEE